MGRYYLVIALLIVGASALSQQQQNNKTTDTFVFKSTPDFIPAAETDDLTWTGESTDNIRVSLALDDALLKDAVKSIFDQFKANYVIDKDVPEDSRVTIHARGLRVSTALDVVTQSAEVGWVLEPPSKSATKNGDKGEHGLYRITSKPRSYNSWTYRTPRFSELQSFTGNSNVFALTPGQSKTRNDSLWFTPQTRALTLNQNGADKFNNVLYELVSPEKRSTITCPHCKGQITVVRTPHTVKCPKCGKVLQAGWQFCPNDGTKRPPDPGEWKFCPLCGKPLDIEN